MQLDNEKMQRIIVPVFLNANTYPTSIWIREELFLELAESKMAL